MASFSTSIQSRCEFGGTESVVHSGGALFVLILLWSGLVVTAMGASETWQRGLMISAIATAIFLPLMARLATGRLDLLEPIVPSALATTIMFVGRPLADQVTNSYIHLGISIVPTFDYTLLTVLLGVIAFNLGYSSGMGNPLRRLFPTPSIQFPIRQWAISAMALAVVGAVLFGIFLLSNGGIRALLIVIGGRSQSKATMLRESSAYFYQAINLLLPAAVIFFGIWMRTRRLRHLAFAALTGFPLFLYQVTTGNRSEMLPLVFGLSAIYYLWKRQRPKLSHLLVAGVVLLVFFAFLREFRDTAASGLRKHSAEHSTVLTDPGKALATTFTKDDSEMFDTFCNLVEVVPDRIEFHPFGIFTDIGIRVLPRVLFPNKPLELPDRLIVVLWPHHYRINRASAAFSILGHYYMYGGIMGVIIGGFLMGVLLRQTWTWYLSHRGNLNAILLYSFVPAFVVLLWRGTVPDTLGRMVFTVLPMVVIQKLLARKAFSTFQS